MLCNFAPVNKQLLKTGNMNKNLFVIMALAAMPTLIFAQQTESSNDRGKCGWTYKDLNRCTCAVAGYG